MPVDDKPLPAAPRGLFWLAATIGALSAIAAFALGALWISNYGGILFLGGPTLMGFVAGTVINSRGSYRFRSVYGAGFAGILIVALFLVVFALEGLICLAMAVPLAIPGSWLGALLSLLVTRNRRWPRHALGLVFFLMPALFGAEALIVEYPVLPVVSRVLIDAPPRTVWQHVIGFAELPPATESIFRLGIAHPVRARIEGVGVGAIRYCEFSTGPFVEPVTVWDPPHRLAFDVVEQPPPMHEWSPYNEVYAPHLLHGLESRRGEFLLIATNDGRTLLQGTTWYRVNMGPHAYWRAWSNFLIRGIHRRVLNHVKALSETE